MLSFLDAIHTDLVLAIFQLNEPRLDNFDRNFAFVNCLIHNCRCFLIKVNF